MGFKLFRCGRVMAMGSVMVGATLCPAATVQSRYYARAPQHDRHGVIAPWYAGQNGQLDFRIRVAAETLKRYPWVLPPQSVAAAPHYVFSGHWKIAPDGTITPLATKDWDTGDLGQRAAYVLSALVDYYRYSGDAAAIAHLAIQADALLDHCLTPEDHPWPRFLVSVPVKGKCYGRCDPRGMIQLDIVAEVGLAMLRAYQVTGNRRWLEACCHWGDLLASKRNRQPGGSIARRQDLAHNGYTLRPLAGGDCLVTVRHDGMRSLVIAGQGDPQQLAGPHQAVCEGTWSAPGCADRRGASIAWTFRGNQVRLLGDVAPDGGLAAVFLDGKPQLVGIDAWNPAFRKNQVLYYRNGLADGQHTLKIVVLGRGNPLAPGAWIRLRGLQFSEARGPLVFGEGHGPAEPQRMVFGYPGREDLKDSAGNLWRPATEWVIRTGSLTDSVEKAWWTSPVTRPILGTPDADLYRYGAHGREFWLNATVGPGKYYVRLKFAATRGLDTCAHCVSVAINGQPVVQRMDVTATAGGPDRAVDLVFSEVPPQHGAIEIRFRGGDDQRALPGEAFVQAVEIGPGSGGRGAQPVTLLGRNLLRNNGFEDWEHSPAPPGRPEAQRVAYRDPARIPSAHPPAVGSRPDRTCS